MLKLGFLTTSFPKFKGDSHAPWIFEISKMLVKNSLQVNVMAPSDFTLKSFSKMDNVNVSRFRYAPKILECVAYGANIPSNLKESWKARIVFPLFLIGFVLGAIKLYKDNDIIHAHFGYSGIFVLLSKFCFFYRKKPIIVSFYGRDVAHAKKFNLLYRLVFREFDKILVLGDDMKKNLIELGAPSKKVVVHHLGVNLKKIRNEKKIKNEKKITFLSIANFVEKKGLTKLIYAFSELSKKYKNIELRLVGRGPLEKALKKQAKELNLNKKIKFYNNYQLKYPRKKVFDECKNADIFVLPGSLVANDYGGTPIVLMEAGATGLPSITFDNAGNKEIVINNKTGFVIKNDNQLSLIKKMEQLMLDEKLRLQYGKNAFYHIKKFYNLELQTNKLEKLYRGLIEKK